MLKQITAALDEIAALTPETVDAWLARQAHHDIEKCRHNFERITVILSEPRLPLNVTDAVIYAIDNGIMTMWDADPVSCRLIGDAIEEARYREETAQNRRKTEAVEALDKLQQEVADLHTSLNRFLFLLRDQPEAAAFGLELQLIRGNLVTARLEVLQQKVRQYVTHHDTN